MMILRLILVSLLAAGCALEIDNPQEQDGGTSDGLDAGAGDNGSGDNPLGCQDECLSGRRQCAAGGFQVCGDYDEDLCTEWSTEVACAAGEYCDEGECVSECQDACSLGQTSCGVGGVETCSDHDQDGCLEWGGWSPCGEERTCQGGECVWDCSGQCSQGLRRCADGSVEGIETCAEYDGDPCLEWGGLQPCGPDLVCDPAQLKCVRPYPPGPYGTAVGDVLRNLCLEECRCDGTVAKGLPFCMRDLLDNKATLISVHTGWCEACQAQNGEAESLYQAYRAQGLGMVFVLFEDYYGNGSRQALLDRGCWEKGYYGLTFMIAIDPGLQQMLPYFFEGSIPLNIIVDDEMVIRYLVEGYDAPSLEATIRVLMAE